ncbi:T-cell surface glycoprotein CD3 gamma chain [Cottoperca gobio]|uniref:T-cell surface glycoprotein CD3 gamma chain-like n=1 Tax=Cottoperca gobio TaxID=56716 RepID=A0A6J2QV77_COTGO|nr:T-cell surface glycoprotein CD3 gamma chain-like [Cottoperca gobio]XP_029302519.1 T-cell surface glycoprotein CD3 gamma chain-like [Cottoperca gobio]
MKTLLVLPASLLLLTLTAPVGCAEEPEIKVANVAAGIKLSCGDVNQIQNKNGDRIETLKYDDENTGEYTCAVSSADGSIQLGPKIFVKYRTCDDCIEIDMASIVGMAVGDVVATIVIGVAVYLLVSQTRAGPITSVKKSSDRQHLVPNSGRSSAPDDHYQPLKNRQKDIYDMPNNRRPQPPN